MRFAVRRPATRPASPRRHRPPGGDVPVLWAGPSRRLAARDDSTGASPAERTVGTGTRGLTPPDRIALATVLVGPAGGDLDLSSSSGRPWDRGPTASTAPGPSALAGVLAGTADGAGLANGVPSKPRSGTGMCGTRPGTRDGLAGGPAAGPRACAETGTTALDLTPPGGHIAAMAGEGPEVLTPTRVMPGRPTTWPSAGTVDRLGETTGTLLLRHLRTRPAKDASRLPLPDAPSTTSEIPRRERRPLTGRQAGASTPRTR